MLGCSWHNGPPWTCDGFGCDRPTGRLRFRLTRSDGVVLYDEVVLDEPEARATAHADRALAAAAEGYGWRLEVNDPDAVVLGADEWATLVEQAPPP